MSVTYLFQEEFCSLKVFFVNSCHQWSHTINICVLKKKITLEQSGNRSIRRESTRGRGRADAVVTGHAERDLEWGEGAKANALA